MEYKNKQISPKIEYIKALIWFRGGTKQDAIDCYNYWKSASGGWRMLNAYLDRYNQYKTEVKI